MRSLSLFPGQPGAYQVDIGSGILSQTGDKVRSILPKAEKIAVFTDTNVGPLYLERLTESLDQAGLAVYPFIFPAGEESKNLSTYASFLAHLADSGLTRTDAVLALGGGVTGDMAGFAAATFLRGIAYVQIPTSLLAAVDSSVGGKTAVDLPQGKNLVGAFKQPACVLCDTDLLGSLPEREWSNGMAEVIKYGVLYDRGFFDSLSSPVDPAHAEDMIARCVEFKAKAVEFDETDHGSRQFLNLGHTLGHAIEKLSSFTVPHGFAVAAGMVLIARAGEKKGLTEAGTADEILRICRVHGLPCESRETAAALYEASLGDKKRSGSRVSVIVPETIGRCSIRVLDLDAWRNWAEAGKE